MAAKLAIRELAKELRGLGDTLDALGEVAESKALSSRKRQAILTAIKALSFACDRTRILDFNVYLLNWPGELTAAEERHLVELGIADKYTQPPAPKSRKVRRRRRAGKSDRESD